MKQIFTLCMSVLLVHLSFAQTCTISGFDICTNNTSIVSDFRSKVLVSGTALTAGSVYKFNNMSYTSNSVGIDAYITIDKIVNASLTSGVSNPNIDDDAVSDETGSTASHVALFAPRIAPDINLSCTNRRGYVQFTVRFYQHTTTNTIPSNSLLMPLQTLNFLHFDMDGFKVGSNGWFKEIGYVKKLSASNPMNLGSANSELTNGGTVTDADGDWFLTFGSTTERDGVSRCAEVIEKSVYTGAQSSVTFRFGYDYKAPVPCNGANAGQPTRQYGSKFGCFSLPNAAPVPVYINNLSVSYNKGVSTVNWSTQQEINVDRFEVERSFDGSQFNKIGSVAARNIASEQKYSYADHSIPADSKIVYYRLRSVDKDNSSKISSVVLVRINNAAATEMSISPNPAFNEAQVKVNVSKAGIAEINVYDATGKLALTQKATVQAGTNSIAINNIITLNPGIYIVKVISGIENTSSKLVIRK